MSWPEGQAGIRAAARSQSLLQAFIIGPFVTVTPPLSNKEMHGALQHLLTTYGEILWNIIHHDEPHSFTRSISTLGVPTSCLNTSIETW